MKNTISAQLFEEAKNYFPGGVNSPVRAFRSVGGTPVFIERGKGSHIWDVDGNEYLDYCGSWGPLILGHANDKVLNAVAKTMQNGTSFGAPTRLENQLAELIISNNRFIEKIRFVSSGTEAVMSAIRLARGFTGRNKILKFEGCYHGHSDSLLVKAGSGLVTFGNTSSEIACVIIEPIPANNGLLLQDKAYLQFLREICTKNGTLLLFDEVISGFRVGFEGAAGYYDIKPDIVTYGKIIGGGFPVGAYGASKEIMSSISPDGNVYQAGTLSGNPVAMSAGIAQLTECLKSNFYTQLEAKTKQLVAGLSEIKKDHFKVFTVGSIFWLAFTEKEKIQAAEEIDGDSMKYFKTLFHHLLSKGVYLGPSGYEVGFINEAHTDDDIRRTILLFKEAMN